MAKKRRKADPTARVSEQMKAVLLWVYNYERPEPTPGTYTRTATGEIVVHGFERLVEILAPWQPSVFIGENPTPSKSTTLSNTLKRLEERGLLNRYSVKDGVVTRLRGKGMRMRTTHLYLTHQGSLFAQSLTYDDFDLEEHNTHQDHLKLERQVEGLRFALTLIRERVKQGKGDDAEQDARNAWSAVNESLKQLMAKRDSEAYQPVKDG
jgi:DNA-binding MarR family transcriptional regulator